MGVFSHCQSLSMDKCLLISNCLPMAMALRGVVSIGQC